MDHGSTHIQSLMRVHNCRLRLVLHVPHGTELAVLKALADGDAAIPRQAAGNCNLSVKRRKTRNYTEDFEDPRRHRCLQQVSGRKILEEDGPKKEVQPTNDSVGKLVEREYPEADA
ncbi:hypothetical protein Trydic_g7586 [Trypoxylus dichotomus]